MTGPDPRPPRRPNAIELAFRQAGMTPEARAASQTEFRERMADFRHDFPRALPGGAAQAIGEFGTDVASLDLPFLPPAFPAVREAGDELTAKLTAYLHRLFGAPEGSEGTEIGSEIGGIGALTLGPEVLAALAATRPAAALPRMGHQAGEWSWASPPVQGPVRAIREAPIGRGPPVAVPAREVSEIPAFLRRQFESDPNFLYPMRQASEPRGRVQPWNVMYRERNAVPFTLPGDPSLR